MVPGSYMFVPGLFKMTLAHIPDLYLCHTCLSHSHSNDIGATFYIVPGSYMFVPVLFKMTPDYIPYGRSYVCPSAI
jgi:hypothetical protein